MEKSGNKNLGIVLINKKKNILQTLKYIDRNNVCIPSVQHDVLIKIEL